MPTEEKVMKVYSKSKPRSIPELEAAIAGATKELERANKKVAAAERAATKILGQINKFVIARDRLILAQDRPELDPKLMLKGEPGSDVMYDEQRSQLAKIGLARNGKWSDTKQTAVSFSFYENGPSLETIKKGIELLAPHILPADEHPWKRFIFNSNGNSYVLGVPPEDSAENYVIADLYRSKNVIQAFDSLEAALQFIQKGID